MIERTNDIKKYIIMCYGAGGDFHKVMELSPRELKNWCEYFYLHSQFENWDSDRYYIWEYTEENLKYAINETKEIAQSIKNEPEDIIHTMLF